MRIAVTYENGMYFSIFGKTEFFKVYEVKDGQVISSEVIGSNGADTAHWRAFWPGRVSTC